MSDEIQFRIVMANVAVKKKKAISTSKLDLI